ncbi:MAG: hypothetical protein V1799_19980 [bacterium]
MKYHLQPNLTFIALFLLIFSLLGCSAFKPPKEYSFENKRTFLSDQDKVWSAVVEYFAEQNIPIKNMDKSSGFIATEYWISPSWVKGSMIDADCGELGGLNDYQTLKLTVQFNVFVKKLSETQTSAQVNTTFRGIWNYQPFMADRAIEKEVNCSSTGKLEAKVLDGITAKLVSN